MTIQSDKWIRNMAKNHEMIIHLKRIRLETIKYLTDFLLTDMMPEFQMNLRFLLM